jgi:hypothetical protein
VLEIASQVDGGHPSPSKLALEAVVPVTGPWRRQSGHESSEWVIVKGGHMGPRTPALPARRSPPAR